jgi:hypothetical protein
MKSRIARVLALTLGLGVLVAVPAQAERDHSGRASALEPGNLLVSTSVYTPADIQAGVTPLPPGCTGTGCMTAVAGSTFPLVFNNDAPDANFGVTSKVLLDELTPWGEPLATIPVPDNQFVTSFSSKSELALNLSPEGRYVSFMGYASVPATIDVSNANTPGVIDPGNPVTGAYYRVAAQLDRHGNFTFTETNAFSGDNGRAAIVNDEHGQDLIYAAGNAGQSKKPPAGVILGAGAEFIAPSSLPESAQNPGPPTPLGSFNITELNLPADKFSKDNNYRGITIHDNVVYYTKGSGSNGVNTVYFVDTTGKACPNGVGLPEPGAQLPTGPLAYDPTVVSTQGVKPNNMCILRGFPTNLATSTTMFPFGMWFANSRTLYVADEGSGDNTYSTTTGQYTNATATAQPTAGLEKWVFDSASGQWKLAYTLQNGLDLGQPYTIPGYPTGENPATGLPWSPATDGLRGLTGRVGRDGIATIWAVTSTVSGGGDQGADPDKLVAIDDPVYATTPRPWESFATVHTARLGEILRGVSFTPGTRTESGSW